MATSVYEERHLRAWELRYRTALDVEYWKRMIARKDRKKLYITIAISVIGLLLSITIFYFSSQSYTTMASALCIALVAYLNQAKEYAASREPRYIFTQWSDLAYDADRFWTRGMHYKWRKPIFEKELLVLEEREKLTDSREFFPQDDELVLECQKRINKRFARQHQKEAANVEGPVTESTETATVPPATAETSPGASDREARDERGEGDKERRASTQCTTR